MKAPGMGWFLRSFLVLSITGTVLLAGGVYGVYWYFSRDLPKIITPADYRPTTVTQVFAESRGQKPVLVAEFFKERRYLVPFESIPEIVVRAFVAAEDDRFFEHQGIDPVSILRAAIVNFRAGHFVQGGSTITQQITKSLLLTPDKNIIRKVKELILAARLERYLDKKQILYLYLNEIYLGHGAYGVQAAAKTYFNKDVGQMTVAEAALIAGLPQAPGKYSPFLNSKKAKERQLYVLRRMQETGVISQSQMAEAAAQPIKLFGERDINRKLAPWVVENVRRYLLEKYGEKALYQDGLKITIRSNVGLTDAAGRALQEGLRSLDKRQGWRTPPKHLATTAEIEKHLREQRLALVEQKLGYRMFLPDGRVDTLESMTQIGIQHDTALLDAGKVYPAVVAGADEKRKSLRILIASAQGWIAWDQLKWAKPQFPLSKFFPRGSVIEARILKTGTADFEAALEQHPEVQGALISFDTRTGDVLTMIGGFDSQGSEFNRAIQAMRQPGSAFKPFIYAAALEKGFTPASVLQDSPLVFRTEDEAMSWKPKNFEEKFFGDTTFRQALIKSRNVPTIKLAQAVEVRKLKEYVKRLGMTGIQLPDDLTISLGSGSVSLMEITRAYGIFPRFGHLLTPVFLAEVKDRDGKTLEKTDLVSLAEPSLPPPPAPDPSAAPVPDGSPSPSPIDPPLLASPPASDPGFAMDPRVAYVMTHLMKEVVSFGTGYGARGLGRVSAGKTGTTSEGQDAWYIGFTPGIVTGVWVGFDAQKSLGSGETGGRAALPIWLDYMREAVKLDEPSDFEIPPGIVFASINPKTGGLARANSSSSIREAFIAGTEPTEAIEEKIQKQQDSQTNFLREDMQ